MPTTATFQYIANRTSGSATVANLVAAMAAVSLPTSQLLDIGVTLTSDVTIAIGSQAQRTLQFGFTPIFQSFPLNAVPLSTYAWSGGSIVSSSEQDKPGGGGAEVIRIRQRNALVAAQEIESVTLNGTTPVELKGTYPGDGGGGFATFPTFYEVVSGVSNVGFLQQFTMPLLQGTLVNYVQGTSVGVGFQGSIFSTSPDDRAGGDGARTVTINYTNNLGLADSEVLTLNGTTPVNTVNTNYKDVTNMTITTAGAMTANLGTITFKNAINGTGGIAGRIKPSYSSYLMSPTPINNVGFFAGLFRQILASSLQCTVSEVVGVV